MKKMKEIHRKAFTVVEIIIALAIFGIIVAGLMNLLASGFKDSIKGMSHQANMDSGMILLSQIEYDFQRSTKIISPINKQKALEGHWELYYERSPSRSATVNYQPGSDGTGIERKVVYNGKIQESQVFAKGHKVKLFFTHLERPGDDHTDNNKYEFNKDIMFIEIEVNADNANKTVASFSMQKLMVSQTRTDERITF